MRGRLLGAAGALMLLALVAGCGGTGPETAMGLADDATVTYAFQDSSVPPQYHRSVTLTVTRDNAHIVIDSYGDVLADETVGTPPAVWQSLGSTLTSLEPLEVAPPKDGCVGGTGIHLTVSTPSEALVDLDPQFCGGSNASLEAPIQAWIDPARSLFPATDVLAPEGE